MKRWTIVFRALANINRLKIIKLLSKGETLTVTNLAEELKISLKATSQHLRILHNLDVLESVGTQGHVIYSLSKNLPSDIKDSIRLFI
jgi:DNA-binding transcriptional ArsR family regulator